MLAAGKAGVAHHLKGVFSYGGVEDVFGTVDLEGPVSHAEVSHSEVGVIDHNLVQLKRGKSETGR